MSQTELLIEAMKAVVPDLDTADALFTDILSILTKEQLNVVEDLITNHYSIEDES